MKTWQRRMRCFTANELVECVSTSPNTAPKNAGFAFLSHVECGAIPNLGLTMDEKIEVNEKKKKIPGVIYRRKWLTLEQKLQIIRAHESGKTYAKIARENGMNESSIRSILHKKELYKEQARSSASFLSKVVTRQRSSLINQMERLLISWIEDCNQKRIQLTESAIQRQALTLFNELKLREKEETNEKFAASRGWFHRFKNRANLHNCVIFPEKPAVDKTAAEKFCSEFRNIVEGGGYSPQQIFNVEETTLYWKRLPNQTFLPESEKNNQGYKASRDNLTLLLGSNASGDFKLKPLAVSRAETPFALRDCEKSSLPVIWRSNKKCWLNEEIFEDWFLNYFRPAAQAFCLSQGLEFKILLLLDSAPSFHISHSSENVQIVYIPTNTASVVQPMSQWVFPLFKAFYLRQIFSQAVEVSPTPNNLSFQDFWNNYNIKNAITNISTSWSEIPVGDLTASWHKLIDDVKPKDYESQIQAVATDIATMGKYFGFNIQDIPNVQASFESQVLYPEHVDQNIGIEVVVCKEEPLDIQDEEFQEEFNNEKPPTEDLEKIIECVDVACETILATDSNVERSIKVRQALQSGIQCYRDLYVERMKTQTSRL